MNISVIIPVYNAEKYLRKAVLSALEQPETAEIILVEDASPDNALLVCQELEQEYEKVKLYQHPDKKNHGAGASRNLGILKATAKYIAFLDSDDYYLPNRFSKDIEILENNEAIDGVYNALGFELYDEEAIKRNSEKPITITTVVEFIDPNELFEQMAPMGIKGYFSGDALTVKREVFDKIGLFDITLELSQDTHMWVKMAAKCCLVGGEIVNPVAIRGVHSENRTTNKEKRLKYRPLLYLSLYKWANENKVKKLRVERILELYLNSLRIQENKPFFLERVKIICELTSINLFFILRKYTMYKKIFSFIFFYK